MQQNSKRMHPDESIHFMTKNQSVIRVSECRYRKLKQPALRRHAKRGIPKVIGVVARQQTKASR
ncbi:hypothetical protein EGX44_03810 [Yersinia pseudotuberculosis]|nr:hypothetical protein EGX44_03810 [Yersinia pseudotuberculosis]MBO1550403.1 hypothetical protein [Yersinia pseudotuberculosis]MBO1571084.1 hypothetical protein [Yersinia pseudotuberculosis]MBO1585526.1 hypothetical protein [Yersinia pseudotuberculosis]MBO1635434.1 hypothetical protein [Yersinia pseudotuberculosis]